MKDLNSFSFATRREHRAVIGAAMKKTILLSAFFGAIWVSEGAADTVQGFVYSSGSMLMLGSGLAGIWTFASRKRRSG